VFIDKIVSVQRPQHK